MWIHHKNKKSNNTIKATKVMLFDFQPTNEILRQLNNPDGALIHDEKNNKFVNAVKFLLESNCSPKEIEKVFDKSGHLLKYKGSPRFSLEKDSIEKISSCLEKILTPINIMIGRSVQKSTGAPFNRHDNIHTYRVAQKARWLTKLAGGNKQSQKVSLAAGFSHDLFNLFSRRNHNHGHQIAFDLIPELAFTNESEKAIRRAIFYHNKGFVKTCLKIHHTEKKQNTNTTLNTIQSKFGLPGLALIAADTSEIVNRQRFTTINWPLKKILKHVHPFLSLFSTTSDYVAIQDKNHKVTEISRTVKFTPFLNVNNPNEKDISLRTNWNHQKRLPIPTKISGIYQKKHLTEFQNWSDLFFKFQGKWLIPEAIALFATNPKLKLFKFTLADNEILNSPILIHIKRNETFNFAKNFLINTY